VCEVPVSAENLPATTQGYRATPRTKLVCPQPSSPAFSAPFRFVVILRVKIDRPEGSQAFLLLVAADVFLQGRGDRLFLGPTAAARRASSMSLSSIARLVGICIVLHINMCSTGNM